LEKRAKQVLPGSKGIGGRGREKEGMGEGQGAGVRSGPMYAHMNKF
jgi:hypothetical protein